MRRAAAALLFLILSACSGLSDDLFGEVLATPTQRPEQAVTIYRSSLGFAFEVPSGWQVSTIDGGVLIRHPEAAQNDGYRVLECMGAVPRSCLSNSEMPGKLISTSSTSLAGHPATEFLFERGTAAATRQWLEYVTVITKDGKIFAVGAMIPSPGPEIREQYIHLYRQISESFRFGK